MHGSPDPITTQEQAARERDSLLDFFARGLHCTMASVSGGHGEPGEEALARSRAVADDYLAAYEQWLVKLAATTPHPARSDREARRCCLRPGCGTPAPEVWQVAAESGTCPLLGVGGGYAKPATSISLAGARSGGFSAKRDLLGRVSDIERTECA